MRLTLKRTARLLRALSLLLCLCAHAPARDDYPRRPELDALRYRIRLALAETGAEINAETEIVFALKAEGVRAVTLDLAGLNVEGVAENGRAAQFTRAGAQLRVSLGGAYKAGELLTLAVKYRGAPTDG